MISAPISLYEGHVSGLDYAIANLETTFGGDDYPYQGNPAFNCPDALIDSVVDTGYDMLLTANNHAGDTMASGITRTIEVIRGKGLTALGSQLNADEPKYAVVDVNGIKIRHGVLHLGIWAATAPPSPSTVLPPSRTRGR